MANSVFSDPAAGLSGCNCNKFFLSLHLVVLLAQSSSSGQVLQGEQWSRPVAQKEVGRQQSCWALPGAVFVAREREGGGERKLCLLPIATQVSNSTSGEGKPGSQ